MTFKEKLVILRKMKGITQDDFASAVGVSRQAVYKWECGQSYPEVPKLLEMKMLFGISLDDLLDDNYDIPVPEKKKSGILRSRFSKKPFRASSRTDGSVSPVPGSGPRPRGSAAPADRPPDSASPPASRPR